MLQTAQSIIVEVSRFTPGVDRESKFQKFEIESTEPLSVKDLLARVHSLDPTFACRTSTCFKGKCGSCLVRVNGNDVFGCLTMIQPGESVLVEPHSKFKRIRDVVVDFSEALSFHPEG